MTRNNRHLNGIKVLQGVKQVIDSIEKLPCVKECKPTKDYGPSRRGNSEGFVEYFNDTDAGLLAKVHVKGGYQLIHIELESKILSLWDGTAGNDPRRIVIDFLVYNYQMPYKIKNYRKPDLMPNH
jgi:hypothetical protein